MHSKRHVRPRLWGGISHHGNERRPKNPDRWAPMAPY